MPGKDGTGPLGRGPLTGRGAGNCPGARPGTGRGAGFGGGRGAGCSTGFGGGRGAGRGAGRGTGRGGGGMRGGIQILSGEQELMQRRELELQAELKEVQNRLRELKKDAADEQG